MSTKLAPQASAKIALHCSIWSVGLEPLPALQGFRELHKYHILNTQILLMDISYFNLLHVAHFSRAFYASRGNSRCWFQIFLVVSTILKCLIEKSSISILLCVKRYNMYIWENALKMWKMKFLFELPLARPFLSKIHHTESACTLNSLLLLKNSGLVLHFKNRFHFRKQ